MEFVAFLSYVIWGALGVLGAYLAIHVIGAGVLLYLVASKNGTIFFDRQCNKWEAWFGQKTVSTKVEVMKIQGNIVTLIYTILKNV